jgi:alkylation response protein AidB-like acyl-CoA dehydrogenase
VSADFGLPEEVAQLREVAARFAAEQLAPAARAAESAGCLPDEVLAVLERFSLRGLDLPERLGGDGAGCLAKVVLLETLAAGDPGGLLAADQPGPAAGALEHCPDAGLAGEIAAECLAGRAQCALVVPDPELVAAPALAWAPSWPAPRWAFESAGERLRLLELPALEPVAALAFHASGGGACALAGARVLGEWRLATPDGVAVRGRARLWLAAVAVGVGQAAFDATIAYTRERIVFGKPVAHHQGNAFELAVAAANLQGARLMVRDAAAGFARGDPHAGFWATQAWLGALEAAIAATDLGVQLLGGHGFLVDHLAEKRFREARMLALLCGGRDAADADGAALVLDVPDPLVAGAAP